MPTTPRGLSARKYLRIDWQYPVYSEPEPELREGQTVARQARRALSREQAFAYIAGEDPRPLLVLRECLVCNGTDDALLKTGADNEKTFLLSRWYHCVKLPPDVMEENHPFHELFVQEETEHLFVASADGSNHRALESQTSRVELWESMSTLLGLEYQKRPKTSLKRIAMLLDKLDVVDRRAIDLERKRDELLEKEGPRGKKARKAQEQVAKIQAERDKVEKEIAKESGLELKRKQVPAKASTDEASAGL